MGEWGQADVIGLISHQRCLSVLQFFPSIGNKFSSFKGNVAAADNAFGTHCNFSACCTLTQ